MRKMWSGVIAASFVATVGLSAQQPPATAPVTPGSPQQPAPTAPASGQSRSVTLSGCIQNAPAAGASATAGGASASASASTMPKFVLSTKGGGAAVGTSGSGAPGAAGAAGAAGTAGTSGTAVRYSLDGEEKTISPHLNHQVEITGTVQNSGASASSAGAGAGAAAATPMLKVESLKMVSATCS